MWLEPCEGLKGEVIRQSWSAELREQPDEEPRIRVPSEETVPGLLENRFSQIGQADPLVYVPDIVRLSQN